MTGNYKIYRYPGKIRKLLNNRRINVNSSFASKKGVLHLAARAGNVESVRLLVKSGADIDKQDYGNSTPLHFALFYKKLEVVRYFIQEASVDLSKSCYRDILSHAAKRLDLSIVELLLSHGADPHYVDSNGECSLHYLSWIEKPEILRPIIEATVDINRQDSRGYSILHKAVTSNNLFLIQELIKRGANVNSLTRKEDTPLHLAMFDYRGWLSKEPRCHEITKSLLEAGARPNAKNESLMTPLMYALQWQDEKLIKILLDGGADPNVKSCTGQSVLHFTVEKRCAKVMRVLLAHPNIDTDQKCSAGFTALHFAVARNKYRMIELLLQRGANVNLADSNGKSPLLMAILGADLWCVELLMNYGARVEKRDIQTVVEMRESQFKNRVSKELVEGMAKLGYADPVLEDEHREAMLDHIHSEMFYDHCLDELREMQLTKIDDGCCVTVLDLLMRAGQIKGYARNELLENGLIIRNQEFKKKFPIFFNRIWHRFSVAAQKQKRIEKAAQVVNDIFFSNSSLMVISYKIVSHLNDYELAYLLPIP